MPERLPPLPPIDRPAWRARVDALVAATGLGVGTFAVVGALIAALVVVAAAVVTRGETVPGSLPVATPAAPVPADEPASSSSTTTDVLVVDVAGAVVRPGLHRLPGGSRVADALAAAGGGTPDADLAQVNQARPLSDGEQVRVPRRGEVLPPSTVPPASGSGGSATTSAPVDLNAASAADLDALPGVGPATAAAIVAWRDRNGRFRTVDDLLEVPGIGEAKLERLRPLVRV